GACDPIVRTPFGPVVEALAQLTGAIGPEALRTDLGSTGPDLMRLLPDLRPQLGGLETLMETDPDTGRHRLHTAVADLLVNTSRRQPLILVLEDLHWADGSTLLLLRHRARSASIARMLVLATFRDVAAEVPAELADALADLRRADGVVRLKLAGLNEESVAEFVRRSAGGDLPDCGQLDVDPSLVASIVHLTGGIPFLLCEFWRMLAESNVIAMSEGRIKLTRPLSAIGAPESV